MLTFRFSGADGVMVEKETLTTGMVGKEIKLEFSEDWNGLSKTAVFMAGCVTRDVVGVTDTAVIPAEVLEKPLQRLYVGVYGVSEDGRVTPTVRAEGPWILPGIDPSGDEGTDPGLPVWAQLQIQIDELNEGGGKYYLPQVTQPADNKLQFQWVPSRSDMPVLPPEAFVLSGTGLTDEQISALHGMFRVCAFSKGDVSAEYAAFTAAFGITADQSHIHSYTAAVTTPATCTTAGVRTYTCACGASYTEPIPATGHSDSGGVCTVCGAATGEATLTGISAAYTGGDVAAGTALGALTGITVTGNYSDGTTQKITNYTLAGTVAAGSNTITVSYEGFTATFTVVGIAAEEGPEIIVPAAENAFVTASFDIASTIVTNGVASSNASWEATDYIEIPEGCEYVMWRTASAAAYRGAFFDADKAYIRNITDATAIGAAKQVRDLIPDNAKYIRLSTTTSNGLDSVELSFGNNFVTGWSDTADHYVGSDGTITDGYTGTVQQRVTDGYIQLPDDAAMLIWGSRAGYTYRYMKIVVYDSDFNILTATAYDGMAFFAATDASCVLDLTALTGAAYIRCAAWDNGAAANDDPAAQIVYGYCR